MGYLFTLVGLKHRPPPDFRRPRPAVSHDTPKAIEFGLAVALPPELARDSRCRYFYFVFAGGEPFCDGAAATVFGFSFFGFFASRFPFCSPLAMTDRSRGNVVTFMSLSHCWPVWIV